MKSRVVRIVAVLLALVPAVLAAVVVVMAGTQAGLGWTLDLLATYLPGELSVATARGRLAGPLRLEGLRYRGGGGAYRLDKLDLEWSPRTLLRGRLTVEVLEVDGLDLDLPAGEETASAPLVPGWTLPLAIDIGGARVRDLRIRQQGEERVALEEITLRGSAEHDRVHIRDLRLASPEFTLRADGSVGLSRGAPTDLSVDWAVNMPDQPRLEGQARLNGDWDELRLMNDLNAPVSATLQARLRDPFSAPHWTLDVDLPATTLAKVRAGWPQWLVAGRVHASGDLRAASLAGDLETDAASGQTWPVSVRLEANREGDGSIVLAPFELGLPAQKARATLNGRWQPASGAVDARLEWHGARWPLTGRQEYRSESGSLKLSGGLDEYRLDARYVVGGTRVPQGDWTLSAQGTDKGLRIESLAGQTLGGTLLVQGSLDWAPELAWDLAVAGRQIDPGVQWPGWPGRLQVRLASSGRLADGRLEMSGELTELEGRLRDYPVSGGGRVRLAGEDVRLQDVRLSSGRAQVGIAGEVAREWDIEWHIEAPEVGDLLAGWHGGVEGSGRVRGPREHPGVAGRLAVEDLEAAGLRVARLRGAFDVQGEAAGSLSVEVSAGHLTWSGRSLDRVALNVDGTVASHRARLYGTGTDHAFDLRLAGGWQDAQWTGRLQRLDWTMPETGAWRLAKPAGVSIGVQGQRLDNACWLQDRARLCTTLRRDAGGGAKAVAAVQQVPLSLLQRWLDDDMQLSGSLEARLNVTGEPGAPLLGSAELSVGPGAATFVMGDVPETAAFEGLQAQVRLEEHALSGSGRFSLSKANRIGADWRLPPLVYGSGMATDAPLRVTVKGRVTELALLDVFVEGLEHPSGTLSIDARVQGTLAAPRIEGGAELEGGRVGIYQLGTEVTDVHLGLRAQRDDRLVLTGSAKSGEGVLDVDGILHAESPEGWHGDVTLKGDRFEVVNLPEARALASPDLRVRIRPGRIDLSGKVGIPEAELEPRDFSGTVSPSRDVVLVGEQAPEEETRWDVYTDVTIMLGEHVTFDGFGLNGRIEGELTATDEPKRVTTGRGRLEIVDGTYKAYGQDLKIEQGRLLFVGGPVDNPGLDVRATRKTGEITAGLKVGGTLKAPDFKFYSEPPLSDADTLSYLLLGRPASRTSGGNEAALINAIAKMGMAGANLLGEHSGSPIVLEELGVDRGETQEDASAYIGAYLSPRVYVYYSMGLFNETSRVRVRYDLTERIKLQSETSGEETAGDVIFTLEH